MNSVATATTLTAMLVRGPVDAQPFSTHRVEPGAGFLISPNHAAMKWTLPVGRFLRVADTVESLNTRAPRVYGLIRLYLSQVLSFVTSLVALPCRLNSSGGATTHGKGLGFTSLGLSLVHFLKFLFPWICRRL
jgi:hypothetical protein